MFFLPLIGLAASVIGTGVSVYSQIKATEAANKRARLQQRMEEMRARRQQAKEQRQAQLLQAQSVAQGYAQGAGGSSSLYGATSNIASQAASNVLGINQGLAFSRQTTQLNTQIANAEMIGNIGSGLSSLGGTALNVSGNETAMRALRNIAG